MTFVLAVGRADEDAVIPEHGRRIRKIVRIGPTCSIMSNDQTTSASTGRVSFSSLTAAVIFSVAKTLRVQTEHNATIADVVEPVTDTMSGEDATP